MRGMVHIDEFRISYLEEGRLCVGSVRVVGGIDERPPEAVRNHRLLKSSQELLHTAEKFDFCNI